MINRPYEKYPFLEHAFLCSNKIFNAQGQNQMVKLKSKVEQKKTRYQIKIPKRTKTQAKTRNKRFPNNQNFIMETEPRETLNENQASLGTYSQTFG